ncbi:NAD-dependent succinate-semialdehyde dehydrogenase [Telmatospirillum sp. J64-1]|uniref:NAD-dependent succinate-semialdehyde dehydrogenase n=1 Tax=Telmatospirillum sp. J64-1 TaxID=2502183 RepID=UPI00115EE951|nr:NAD-dependent succinate-semialdehyde dehydrogenase [Telmatospirillum sp. J64-1]
MYDRYGLHIKGEWRAAKDGATRPVTDPARESELGHIPAAGPADLDDALVAAETGFHVWRRTSPWERSAVLHRAAALIRERTEDIAALMSAETGKPLAEARGETGAAADQFEWYAEEAKRIYGQTIEGRSPDSRMMVKYEPVGVVAAFSAWNFPALLPARKMAAALAAGCSVILKPAGETPGSAMALVQALADAGLPDGVMNLVTGNSDMIARHLIASPIVRKVSLTGSVPVGREMLRLCVDDFKKVSMELGGHAPVLVFEDADPVAAATAAATAKFRNCGQVCISPSRFYVHESIAEPFTETFANYAKGLKIGRGLDAGVQIGPMANPRGLQNALNLIEDAKSRGARVVTGGGRPPGINSGYFIEPTVLADVPDEARIMNDEPFAPVAPITKFRSFDEVIKRANSTPFGLAGYVFTNSLRTATLASEALEVGMVGVNEMLLASAEMPFGGIKHSGMGREGGSLGIKEYLEPKFVKMKI